MTTQELYHRTKGDNILHILREGVIRPKDGQIFFCKWESQLHTLFVHGVDDFRDGHAFVIKVKVHFHSHDQLQPCVTSGVPDTWVLSTSTPVKAEIEALLIRRRPGQPVETVIGSTEINNLLQLMGRRVHPVFKFSLDKILAELKRLNWRPYIDNISRTSAEQAEKVRLGYSKTMRSWHVETTAATLAHGSTGLDVVHGNAADSRRRALQMGWGCCRPRLPVLEGPRAHRQAAWLRVAGRLENERCGSRSNALHRRRASHHGQRVIHPWLNAFPLEMGLCTQQARNCDRAAHKSRAWSGHGITQSGDAGHWPIRLLSATGITVQAKGWNTSIVTVAVHERPSLFQ
jgi:hypothetical protein